MAKNISIGLAEFLIEKTGKLNINPQIEQTGFKDDSFPFSI